MADKPYASQLGHALKYSRPPAVHPDYRPDGIAPRLGHALQRLAADPHAADAVRGLAYGALETGDHSLLPVLADALDESGHEAAGWFDWRHAPRGVAVDHALQQAISALPQRRYAGGAVRHHPISPGWVATDWRNGVRSRLPKKAALAAVRAAVPDASWRDVAHSVLRLMDIQYAHMPQLRRWRQAATPYADHSHEDHTSHLAVMPPEMPPSRTATDAAMLRQLMSFSGNTYADPDGNVHRYPDPRGRK